MPEKQRASLMSAGAALMFVALCANLLLRAKPHIFSFHRPRQHRFRSCFGRRR